MTAALIVLAYLAGLAVAVCAAAWGLLWLMGETDACCDHDLGDDR